MATLDPSNIVNGNTIQTSDLLQLYQAFGTGSGASITGLAMSGSLNGNASTATLATTATSASNLTTAITGGGTHYLTFVDGAGTRPSKIASLLEYTPSNNNLQVTASYALVAETAGNPTQINTQEYERLGSSVATGNFKFVAGAVTLSGGSGASGNFTSLAGKNLGTDAFITATMNTAGVTVAVTSIGGAGAISFTSTGGSGNDTVYFTGVAIS